MYGDWAIPLTLDELSKTTKRVVIATAGEEGQGFCKQQFPASTVYTPITLGVEQVLVSKFEVPPNVRYVLVGGTVGKDTLDASGYASNLIPGKRYVVFLSRTLTSDGTGDNGMLKLDWVLPIDVQGRVFEAETGRRLPLTEAIRRVKAGGAKSVYPTSNP